jgi:hypothetical protein
MAGPVTKLDLPSYVLAQGVSPIEDWLVAFQLSVEGEEATRQDFVRLRRKRGMGTR